MYEYGQQTSIVLAMLVIFVNNRKKIHFQITFVSYYKCIEIIVIISIIIQLNYNLVFHLINIVFKIQQFSNYIKIKEVLALLLYLVT